MYRNWRLLAIFALLALLFVGSSAPASAIRNGQPDGTNHPYVGLLVFDVEGEPSWRCSGALLSSTVVLTAGHCTDGADAARIWFDPDVTSANNPEYPYGGTTSFEGTPYTYEDFCIGCGNGLPGFAIYDVGIVVLSEPVPPSVVDPSDYAQLPTAGLVDDLAMGTDIDLVGYGVQRQTRGGGPPQWTGPRIRMYAPTELVAGNFVHSNLFIRLQANPAQGQGGTCFGDSGGPNLLGNTVLAVNSYVTNGNCTGVTYSQRVDLPEVLEWINSFLD